MAQFLVTGGAGFIGSHIAATLLAQGQAVRVLDNFSTGLRENLAALRGADVVEGDIRSYHIVQEAMAGVEFVLHQAALPSVPRSVRDPITTNDVNVVGTLNVLTAARDAGVRRLVLSSSSSVYGRNARLPKEEGMAPEPISPYAVSKLTGEYYCRAFTELYRFETVILRYFNVFGPRQNPLSEYAAVVPRLIRQLLTGETSTIYGDGTQTRDFTFVDNVVRANLLACEASGAAGHALNIAAGSQVSLLDLIKELEGIVGRKAKLEFKERRKGDVEHSFASILRAEQVLGYKPTVALRAGLQRTVESMRELGAG